VPRFHVPWSCVELADGDAEGAALLCFPKANSAAKLTILWLTGPTGWLGVDRVLPRHASMNLSTQPSALFPVGFGFRR
jgi:hypothetical protein